MSNDNILNKKKIARNTLVLYVKMSLTILVQLYVVPVLLRSLGVEDYGIYNVVAGIVTMFTFVSGALSSGAQRFLAYSIGKDDENALRSVFSSTFLIYLGIAIVLCIILELFGVWFLNTHMDIPVDRIYAANWVFHLTIVFFAIEILVIPFRACIIAHERMNVFAILSICECLLRLAAAVMITYIAFDRLITYSVLLAITAVMILAAYWCYCLYHFYECRTFRFQWDKDLGKSLLTYSGWNMIGSLALISRNQGLNILQNLFFGPAINAAHAIAQQIQGVVARFVDNVYVASRPQITKLYASDRKDEMWNLIFQSAKLAFFLMMFISIPAILELDTVLQLWLHDVPEHTVTIARLMMASLLVETLVNQVIASYQATNRIKRYQMFASTILVLNIPISYLFMKYGESSPQTPYIVSVFLSMIYIVSILWNAKIEVGLDLKAYLKQVLLRNIVVMAVTFYLSFYLRDLLTPSYLRIVYTVLVSSIISFILIWTIGLNSSEKKYVTKIINNKIGRK